MFYFRALFEQLRVVRAIDRRMTATIGRVLEFLNKRRKPWRQDNQIPGGNSLIGVGDASWHEDRFTGRNFNDTVGKTESESAFEDMPCFIVRVMNMQGRWSAASPFLNRERSARN